MAMQMDMVKVWAAVNAAAPQSDGDLRTALKDYTFPAIERILEPFFGDEAIVFYMDESSQPQRLWFFGSKHIVRAEVLYSAQGALKAEIFRPERDFGSVEVSYRSNGYQDDELITSVRAFARRRA